MESEQLNDHTAYKAWLRETEQKLSEHFDKTMLTITGGSLALSITFIKDIIGHGKMINGWLLITSWASLTLCLIIILWSFHLGLKAYRKAQDQVDEGNIDEEIPGGFFSKLLNILNTLSICLLTLGLVCLFTFSYMNLSKESTNGSTTDTETTATAKADDASATSKANPEHRTTTKGNACSSTKTIKVETP